MSNTIFNAFQVTEYEPGKFRSAIISQSINNLPVGDVLVKVYYSSLNYKDTLSAMGNRGITKSYPHVPGIDAAGVVVSSAVTAWQPGDQVIVTGFDLGMNTSGGFAGYIRVPASWLVKLPRGLTLRQSMVYGTAGFTAGLSIASLLRNHVMPQDGPVVVTGATGGVGSVAVAILAHLGYHVIAVSSKLTAHEYLLKLGAAEIIPRSEMEDTSNKSLLKPRFAAAVDTVGGQVLATIIKSLNYGGVVTACGMVNGAELHTTVYPFILKGVQLIGIDSVEYPIDSRAAIWQKLATDWKPSVLEYITTEVNLDQLDGQIINMLSGGMQGRTLVKIEP